MNKKLTIIIPCYNEEQYVENVLSRVIEVKLNYNLEKEIIIVNDGSVDSTLSKIEQFISQHRSANIKLLNHEINYGKGSCIKTALKEVTGQLIVIQDADLEYNPEDFNLLLKPIEEENADVVLGSRFRGHSPRRGPFFLHAWVNKLYTLISNFLTRQHLTDIHTCYKMYKTGVLKNIELEEKRFGIDPEIIAKLSHQKNIKIAEVGISYKGRNFAEGKKINITDGFRAFYCIIKYNLFGKK